MITKGPEPIVLIVVVVDCSLQSKVTAVVSPVASPLFCPSR